jgi:hypothetical protein
VDANFTYADNVCQSADEEIFDFFFSDWEVGCMVEIIHKGSERPKILRFYENRTGKAAAICDSHFCLWGVYSRTG